ncbi:MAG: peptidylprolyl isomerase [Alphaproteobacteria bacterium]|nr:peptidylprolyl isomerase [Alphaproteobacteria bacterium]MDE2041549.1 peptidylprolyl isomerase [Alphaproteobacteria bacterium]MDE2340779.1 peptidylprolyl isomerase [Alphaproteobacteria bacterium]
MRSLLKMLMMFTLLGWVGAGAAYARHHKPPPLPAYAATPDNSVEPPLTPDNELVLMLSTGGPVEIALRPDKAPNHVARIKQLARAHFYDGLLFHRVIDGFMAQTGDPRGDGTGGSPLPDLKAEFNDLPHLRGTVSMARAESNDSANSQFFICFLPTMKLDGKYTVFGRVIEGMQYVDKVERGEPPDHPSKIVRAYILADGPNAATVPLPVVAQPAVATTLPTTPPPAAPPPTPAPATGK